MALGLECKESKDGFEADMYHAKLQAGRGIDLEIDGSLDTITIPGSDDPYCLISLNKRTPGH